MVISWVGTMDNTNINFLNFINHNLHQLQHLQDTKFNTNIHPKFTLIHTSLIQVYYNTNQSKIKGQTSLRALQ